MYWIFIIIGLVVVGIVGTILAVTTYYDEWIAAPFISGLLILIISLCLIAEITTYHKFETQIEIQREQYNQISTQEILSNDDKIIVIDLLSINKNLASWQAEYTTFGNWCIIPERVMHIEPIGNIGGN